VCDLDDRTLEHLFSIEYRVKVVEAPDPRIKQEYSERGLRARQEIIDAWRDCLRPMLDKYPDLDKYM